MKILFLTQSLVHGGAERHTITLANRLAERGHECHAAYVKDDPSQLPRYRGMASITCLEAHRYLDARALRRLRNLLREINPTHVLAANAYALFYAWLAMRSSASPAPLAVTYHTTLLRNAKEWLQMLYYRPLFWSADWLVYVCEAQARYWRRRQLFARRTEVIYNGVDLAHWTPRAAQPLRKLLGFGEEDLVVGMSAVLRAEKNPVQLVDAVAGARPRGPPARAGVGGGGPPAPPRAARARPARSPGRSRSGRPRSPLAPCARRHQWSPFVPRCRRYSPPSSGATSNRWFPCARHELPQLPLPAADKGR
jgi:glycosyltransferase involved in cell wall biosynthesis